MREQKGYITLFLNKSGFQAYGFRAFILGLFVCVNVPLVNQLDLTESVLKILITQSSSHKVSKHYNICKRYPNQKVQIIKFLVQNVLKHGSWAK